MRFGIETSTEVRLIKIIIAIKRIIMCFNQGHNDSLSLELSSATNRGVLHQIKTTEWGTITQEKKLQ